MYQRQGSHFGEIKNGVLVESAIGSLAKNALLKLPSLFQNLRIDCYVIMPNHLHCILTIVGAGLAPALGIVYKPDYYEDNGQGQALPLHAAIGAFKSLTANRIRKEFGICGLWHRNYYKHIIRDHEAYLKIEEYIRHNPTRWEEDRFYGEG